MAEVNVMELYNKVREKIKASHSKEDIARNKLIKRYGEVIALHKQLNAQNLQETETSATI